MKPFTEAEMVGHLESLASADLVLESYPFRLTGAKLSERGQEVLTEVNEKMTAKDYDGYEENYYEADLDLALTENLYRPADRNTVFPDADAYDHAQQLVRQHRLRNVQPPAIPRIMTVHAAEGTSVKAGYVARVRLGIDREKNKVVRTTQSRGELKGGGSVVSGGQRLQPTDVEVGSPQWKQLLAARAAYVEAVNTEVAKIAAEATAAQERAARMEKAVAVAMQGFSGNYRATLVTPRRNDTVNVVFSFGSNERGQTILKFQSAGGSQTLERSFRMLGITNSNTQREFTGDGEAKVTIQVRATAIDSYGRREAAGMPDFFGRSTGAFTLQIVSKSDTPGKLEFVGDVTGVAERIQ